MPLIIRTYGHDYPVSSVMESNDVYDCYICRDLRDKGFCRILSIKDKSVVPDLVSWLSSVVDRQVFTDFMDSFNHDDSFCIVMKYTQGVTLSAKLSMEALTLSERLELGRRILERVVLQDVPPYFLSKCLDENNIIVGSDLSVNFNYPIEDIISGRDADPRPKITKLLELLFTRELERKVPDPVMDFFSVYRRTPELTMIGLYSDYYEMQSKVEGDIGEAPQPKSIWFRLWDKIRSIFKVVKKFAMIALVLIALFYLVLTIDATKSSTVKRSNFDSIGTVEIDKNR